MKMRTSFVVSLILPAALSSAALANETYKFDQSQSTIGFKVHQFLGTTNGRFTKFSGEIDIDREHPEKSSVVARIDVRSIDTRIQKRDDHLRSAEFFNVAKFPEITFKSRSVTRTGPQSGDIVGDLTMHGVTKEVVLDVDGPNAAPKDEKGNQRMGASATTKVNRMDYGVSGAPGVAGDEITITIDIEMIKPAK